MRQLLRTDETQDAVERVARALHSRDPHFNRTAWADLGDDVRERYMADARAAIAAMAAR